MDPSAIDELLDRTFEDHRLSRNERQALAEIAGAIESDDGRASACRRAFEMARTALGPAPGAEVLDWLEEVVKALKRRPEEGAPASPAEAHFSPGEDCPRRIIQLFQHARRQVDVCVFTITDDRLTAALLDAHRRGIAVRVITDNEKLHDEGSDILRLEQAGVPVRVDRTEYHMHHKFAIFDESTLLTGSFNWTRGASRYNDENLIVTPDRRLLVAFAGTFERLWEQLG